MLNNQNKEMLDLMLKHEAKLSELYQAFAQALPEWQIFWQGIARDEQKHEAWLSTLILILEKEEGQLNTRLFNAAGVHTSLSYLQRIIDDVAKMGTTPLRALAISLDIEEALLEKEYFRVYANDALRAQETFGRLLEQTTGHRKLIQMKIDEERARQKKVDEVA